VREQEQVWEREFKKWRANEGSDRKRRAPNRMGFPECPGYGRGKSDEVKGIPTHPAVAEFASFRQAVRYSYSVASRDPDDALAVAHAAKRWALEMAGEVTELRIASGHET